MVGRSRDSQTQLGMVVGRSREKAQFLAEVAGRSLSALLVRSLPCAMSGERAGCSSRETRGAIGAFGDGAADGVLVFLEPVGGAAGNPEAATSPSLCEELLSLLA